MNSLLKVLRYHHYYHLFDIIEGMKATNTVKSMLLTTKILATVVFKEVK